MEPSLEVINYALVLIGEQAITSLAPVTKQARVASTLYEVIRDSELAGHPWHFAKKRQPLARIISDKSTSSHIRYALPSDCLQAIALYHYDEQEEGITHEGAYIVVPYHASPPELLYIARIEDARCYPPLFKEALALKLAYMMADNLTANLAKSEGLRRQYEQIIKKAKHANALLATSSAIGKSSWFAHRN